MASLIPFLFLIIPFFTLITTSVNALPPAGAPTSSPSASSPAASAAPPEIQKICNITKFPEVCKSFLGKSPAAPLDFVKNAITVSVTNTLSAQEMVTKALTGAGKNLNLSQYSSNCLEELSNSMFRLQSSITALPSKSKDARAWMSAALVYQNDCLSNFKKVNDTVEIHSLLSLLDLLTRMTSNALSLVRALDLFGSDVGKWAAPKTERDGFFEPIKSKEMEFPTRFPANLKIDATVSKDGKGYKTVGEGVDAAPSNLTGKKFVINVKEGIYDEIVRIPLEKKNIVLIGDGIGKTIITGKKTVGPVGVFTYDTATFAVMGDGFMAKDITFKNEAGIPSKQAVAFRSDSDKSYVENCEFFGHQDTLYIHGLRQFYKSCKIEGNVDFIFGNGAAYFKDCEIFINPRLETPEKGESNAVTAQGRTDSGQSTGYVFDNCSITGTPEYMKLIKSNPKVHKNYLGRPWKEFAKTVYIHSFMDSLINPGGWLEWEGNQSLSTLYYGEFENRGPGSDLKGRVPWSSKILPQHVLTFSVQNFMQGDEWLPK
ncbi:probable pectinesterase/pectinesterase inhibitor 51 [Euphorbia lathyris]|uniref:probable pectinesterase/pectinesterase inhibitor 51 n=1 Tax=Euphorbia lathyris TaxID=212925 RepID=UPI0033131B44